MAVVVGIKSFSKEDVWRRMSIRTGHHIAGVRGGREGKERVERARGGCSGERGIPHRQRAAAAATAAATGQGSTHVVAAANVVRVARRAGSSVREGDCIPLERGALECGTTMKATGRKN